MYDPFTKAFWASYYSLGVGVVYAKSAIVADDIVFPAANQILLEPEPPGPPQEPTDKPWFAVGRRPGTLDKSNLYMAYSGNAGAILLRRSVEGPVAGICPSTSLAPDANGRCWEPTQNLGVAGFGVVPTVSPTLPEIIYIPYWVLTGQDPQDPQARMEIIKSTDTGANFTGLLRVADVVNEPPEGGNLAPCVAGRPLRIPKMPSIAAHRGKNLLTEKVFLVWADLNTGEEDRHPDCEITCGSGSQADVDIYFARLTSSTQDDTMSVDPGFPKVIVADPGMAGDYRCADQFFPWMAVDGNNVLHVVYFDNRHTPDDPDDTSPGACPSSTARQRHDDSCAMTFDLYYTFSTDDGDTWSAPERITTEAEGGSSFIQDDEEEYFIGDYIGVAADLNASLTESPVVNAAFNRDLDPAGNFLAQEVWVGKIEPAGCTDP